MPRTFDSLVQYTGSRYVNNEEVANLCSTLDNLPCRDLLNVITAVSTVRAEQTEIRSAVEGGRFHEASEIDQRKFHHLEAIIFDALDDTAFIELSPVQPFGLNTALAGLSESHVLATLRRSEVNADVTTALFREAITKNANLPEATVRLASNARITRSQQFDAETKFLPHFRMFGQITVGKQNKIITEQNILAEHLSDEAKILSTLKEDSRFNLDEFNIEVSNVAFMQELIKSGQVDAKEIRKHTADPNYEVFERFDIDLPQYLSVDTAEAKKIFASRGLDRDYKLLSSFFDSLKDISPEMINRTVLNLGRIAGAGYYQNICYKVNGKNKEGLTLPLGDGGTTDWAKKFTGNKRAISVSSGLGTELIARYFME